MSQSYPNLNPADMNQAESDRFYLRDRIKQIETSFIDKGWVTVYQSGESSNEEESLIFCCLVADRQINTYSKNTNWVVEPGREGKPSIIGTFVNGRMKNSYHQFADDGIEPFIFVRSFHNYSPTYVDICEDFVSYFRLYEKLTSKQDRKYYFIDDLGELVEVVLIEPKLVRVRLRFLMEFISIRRMHLSVCFDFMRLVSFNKVKFDLHLQDIVQKNGKTIYSHLVRHMGFGYEGFDLQSWIHGKTVISYDKEKTDKYHFDSDGLYEEFITGYDESGDYILSSCKRDDSNYFIVTYFKKEVLDKYYNDPEKYEVTGWHILCPYFSLKIDNNVKEYVPVFLRELGMLPHREQLHWKQYNIAPQKGISHSYYSTMVEGNWVSHPESPDLFFKQRYTEFNEKWESKYGWKFFKPLLKEDAHNFKGLHIPTSNSIKQFCEQTLALVKIIIDSLNERELSKEIKVDADEKGLSKLEKFLAKRATPIPEMIEFLKHLQSLRSGLVAHRFSESNSSMKRALEYFKLNEANRIKVAQTIFINAVWMVNSLELYLLNEVILKGPKEFTKKEMEDLLRLIDKGGQIPDKKLTRRGLASAYLIGLVKSKDLLLSTATIKKPLESYKLRVFNEAGVPDLVDSFKYELGYIITDAKFEGRKLCQYLLGKLLQDFNHDIFATTRSTSMTHVLTKFGFEKVGKDYKDGLHLLVRRAHNN